MQPVICPAARRNTTCGTTLFKVDTDFTGTVEIKCPRCRTITTLHFIQGVLDVA